MRQWVYDDRQVKYRKYNYKKKSNNLIVENREEITNIIYSILDKHKDNLNEIRFIELDLQQLLFDILNNDTNDNWSYVLK
jgi:hypothetical protein